MIRVTTMFANKIPSANIIFKDGDNKAVTVLYFSELPNQGIEMVNKYRKKNYWDYALIPKTFSFLGHKILTTKYYQQFKQEIPQVRIQRKFVRSGSDTRTVFIDLTPLSEDFAALAKSRSMKMIIEAFLKLVESFAVDNKSILDAQFYLMIDGNNTDQKEAIKSLLYYSRLNSNKLRIKDIDGIILYGNKRFWPLTTTESDKEGNYLKVNINILSRYMKEVYLENIEEEVQETPAESMEATKKVVETLYKTHIGSGKQTASGMYTDQVKKTSSEEIIEENPLELIKAEVQQNKNIKGNTFEEKLANLFKEGKEGKEGKDKTKAENSKIPEMVSTISKNLRELNAKYNGTIVLDEKAIERNAKSFYKPLNIIGFKEFNAYGKQKSEFGDNLDNAMFDLIKSMEMDKDLGIKVLNIKTEITDTYKDRMKTYRIKIQHKDFGYTKPYSVKFHVPIPSKGKYLKVGGNEYIMINQFFSKPVIKISPKKVTMYTHYSTCSITLKHHALNDSDGVDSMLEQMADVLKFGKKLARKPEILTLEQTKEVMTKYGLPEFMNADVLVNMDIKSNPTETKK